MGILSIPDVRARVEAVIEYVDRHDPEDAAALELAFRDATAYVDPASFAILVEWWARFDPGAAFNALNSGFYGNQRVPMVSMVIQQWARADPEAARDALDGLVALGVVTDDVTGDTYKTALAWGWAESGRPGYWEYVEGLESGTTRQRALSGVASWMLARNGAEAMIEFADQLDPGGRHSLKLQFHRRAAAVLSRRDPRRAADWALDMWESPFGEGMLNHVAGEWGRADGEAALEWMQKLPLDEAGEDAVHQAYLQWLKSDRVAAHRWLEENAPGPAVLAPAHSLYIRSVGFMDPPAGAEWLQHLQDSDRYRERTMIFVAQRWLMLDPDTAQAWVDELDLSPEAREELAPPERPIRRNSRAGAPEA